MKKLESKLFFDWLLHVVQAVVDQVKKNCTYIKSPAAENGTTQYIQMDALIQISFPVVEPKQKIVCESNQRIYWRLLNGKRSIFTHSEWERERHIHTARIIKQNIIAFESETCSMENCLPSNFIASKWIMWLCVFPGLAQTTCHRISFALLSTAHMQLLNEILFCGVFFCAIQLRRRV